jgi:hypothetical protein
MRRVCTVEGMGVGGEIFMSIQYPSPEEAFVVPLRTAES